MNDTLSPTPYQGWMTSPNLIKRSFAVLGHSTLATLILYVPLILIAILAIALFGSSEYRTPRDQYIRQHTSSYPDCMSAAWTSSADCASAYL